MSPRSTPITPLEAESETETETEMIQVNQVPHRLPTPLSVTALLTQLAHPLESVAVAVNGAFVPKSQWQDLTLNPGDQVEVVAPMQGG